MTRILSSGERTIQKLHIFDPALLSGQPGGRMEQTYFLPITADPTCEIMAFDPQEPEQAEIICMIQNAFALNNREPGYEILLQQALLGIWLKLWLQHEQRGGRDQRKAGNVSAVKTMMFYIREHFAETLPVRTLAQAAHISERECYRVFRECLHTTPTEYIISVRLQEACRLLTGSTMSVTQIAHSCGFGSSSYLNRVFDRSMGCTPGAYRQAWQDKTNIGRD